MQMVFANEQKTFVACVGGATQRSPALLLFQSIAQILESDPSRRVGTLVVLHRCSSDDSCLRKSGCYSQMIYDISYRCDVTVLSRSLFTVSKRQQLTSWILWTANCLVTPQSFEFALCRV